MNPRTLILAHSEEVFQEGLSAILAKQSHISLVGVCSSGLATIERACELKPDIVMLDCEMVDCDWSYVVRRLRQLLPTTRIILLIQPHEDIKLVSMLRAGVKGFFSKGIPAIDLVAAIHLVADGKIVISPLMVARLIGELDKLEASLHIKPNGLLTNREKETLILVKNGLSNKMIAGKMFITENTVKAHLRKITGKLQVRGRLQAVTLAVEQGILNIEDEHLDF